MNRGSQHSETFSPEALLLDMDGLMVDSEPLWFRVERAFCAERGGDWTDEHALACTGQGMVKTLRAMEATFGFAIDVERDTAAIVEAFIARVGELALKPGCRELLADAVGRVPLALASSSPLRLIDAVLLRFELRPCFDAVVSGESVARPKPAPDIFLRAAAELGKSAAGCAVFEDSLAGVTAGHAAGMFVVAVPEGPWEGRGFEAVASVIVADLFEGRRRLAL